MKNVKKHFAKIGAAASAVLSGSFLLPGDAHAQATTVGGMSQSVQSQLQSVGNLVVAGSFLGGLGLATAGLFKLKAAADSGGQQVKYSEGMWRLAVGGGLVAIPAVVNVGKNTLFGTNNNAPTMGTISIGGG